MTGWSPDFLAMCLRSALASMVHQEIREPEPTDLGSVHKVYHNLSEVFSKSKALSLLLHHPYDCAIDFLLGVPLPTSRLYNLTRPEQEAMETYIQDS